MKAKTVVYLIGSFVFAFLLGEIVHEYGHYLMHVLFGHEGVSVYIDPFGGSKNMNVHIVGMPYSEIAWTTIMGPMTNVILATIVFFVFIKLDFLPIKIWMPVALVQEGVTFSLGNLTQGGDAEWIATTTGIPSIAIWVFGFVLLGLGIWRLSMQMSRYEDINKQPYIMRVVILFFTLGALMIIRAVYAFINSPDLIQENSVPLAFSVIVAFIVALLISKKVKTRPVLDWQAYFAFALGTAMFIFQILI